MLHRLLAAVLMLVATMAVHAEEAAVLASYWSSSGTVAPAAAWSTSVVVRIDGQASLKQCEGFDADGPTVVLPSFPAEDDVARVAAVLQAVTAAISEGQWN